MKNLNFVFFSLDQNDSMSDGECEPPYKKSRPKITDPMRSNKKLENTGPGPSNDVFKLPEKRPLTAAHSIRNYKYELATHTVKVKRTGALQEVSALWDLQGWYPNIYWAAYVIMVLVAYL